MTARDITTGTSATGHDASVGADIATGFGLIDCGLAMTIRRIDTVFRLTVVRAMAVGLRSLLDSLARWRTSSSS